MKNFKIAVTGDALFVADFPREYEKDLSTIKEYMSDCDVRVSNLETTVSKFGDYANATSGGTWINVEPEVFDYLNKFNFNYYGTANNHCMDYSYHGLLSTLEELDKRNLAHSGTGRNLEEASAPAIIESNGKKTAIFAVSLHYNETDKAGEETIDLKGRPGVNFVGHETYLPASKETVDLLKKVAEQTKINGFNDIMIKEGFRLPSPEGIFEFGGIKFCYDGSKKKTECNKKDKERVINAIRKAVKEYDYVFILLHCHDVKTDIHAEAPDYMEELARASIDAGAHAVLGGGTHELRPIEIYKNRPIFYSLGDFIYQGLRVPILPADFKVKYGVDKNAPAIDALLARSKNGKIGLQSKRCNFLTLIPKLEYEEGNLVSFEMMPVVAGFDKEGKLNGLPYMATGEEAQEIYEIISRLSLPFGTKFKLENGFIKLAK